MAVTPRYKVIVSDRAKRMLGLHVRFLANVNPQAARKTKSKISKAIRSLSQLPNRYPFFEAEHVPANKYHRMFVERWYLVLYQIRDKAVYVDFIVDCRQDYGWLIN